MSDGQISLDQCTRLRLKVQWSNVSQCIRFRLKVNPTQARTRTMRTPGEQGAISQTMCHSVHSALAGRSTQLSRDRIPWMTFHQMRIRTGRLTVVGRYICPCALFRSCDLSFQQLRDRMRLVPSPPGQTQRSPTRNTF